MKQSVFRNLMVSGLLAFVQQTVIAQDMPSVIPPSPTAASLGQFGDIPVGFYTGTPNLSIPLYEINCGQLSVPITLSYDATGVRVAQDASWVGLGWSLSAGGLVTRTIRGRDDFKGYIIDEPLPPSNEENEWYLTDHYNPQYMDSATIHDGHYFALMKEGVIDGEPDIFSYNFGNYSGRFVIDKIDNGTGIFSKDRNNLDIRFSLNGNRFTIMTADGCTYIFGTPEEIISRYNNTTIDDPSTVVGLNGLDKGSLQANASWYLDEIISPARDTIKFTYTIGESLSLARKSEKDFQSLPGGNGKVTYYYEGTVSREHIYEVYLSKISFRGGWITFETEDRLDVEPVTAAATKPQRLAKIKVCNSNQLVIKEIEFGQSYFNQSAVSWFDRRLKLDYIELDDRSNRYLFDYIDPDKLSGKYSRQADNWGFYTYPFQSGTGYHSLLPEVAVDYAGSQYRYAGAPELRTDSTGEFVTRGMLQKIGWPTGGYTLFDYEPHSFRNGPPVYKTITRNAIIDYTAADPENYIDEGIDSFTLTDPVYVQLNAFTDYDLDGADVGYLRDSKGVLLFRFDNTGHTETNLYLRAGTYHIEAKSIPAHRSELQASYRVVAGKQCRGNGVRIRSITHYDRPDHIAGQKDFIYTDSGLRDSCCSTGLLLTLPRNYYLKPITINQDGLLYSGVYVVRSSSSYSPQGFSNPPNVVGYSKVWVKEGGSHPNGSTVYTYYNEASDNSQLFPEMPECFDTRNGQLLNVTVVNAANEILQETDYGYALKEHYSLKGAKVYKAPFDNTPYFNYERDVRYYDNFSEWWVQDILTNKQYFNKGSQVLIDTTCYAYDNLVHKQLTGSSTIASDNSLRITRYKYPHDFVGAQPYTDMVALHQWSPVVEVMNYKGDTNHLLTATRTQYKDWGSHFIAPVETDLRTATSAYEPRILYQGYDDWGNLTSISKQRDVANVYVWGYDHTLLVAAITGVAYDPVIRSLNSAVLDNPSSAKDLRKELDQLRGLYPAARIASYTYQPLVGMTSQTDENGKTLYYGYDSLHRLVRLRDREQRILKQYDYQFNVPANSLPDWVATGATRCKPCDADSNYHTATGQRQEVDRNPQSPSWQSSRWVDEGVPAACTVTSYWQTTDTLDCILRRGEYTGEQVVLQMDRNPCSDTYRQTRYDTIHNVARCKPSCTITTCNGIGKKCVNGVCETGRKVYTGSTLVFTDDSENQLWRCTFYYIWRDGSKSARYTEYQASSCFTPSQLQADTPEGGN